MKIEIKSNEKLLNRLNWNCTLNTDNQIADYKVLDRHKHSYPKHVKIRRNTDDSVALICTHTFGVIRGSEFGKKEQLELFKLAQKLELV